MDSRLRGNDGENAGNVIPAQPVPAEAGSGSALLDECLATRRSYSPTAATNDDDSLKPLRCVRGHVHVWRPLPGEIGDELAGERSQRQAQMSVAECEEHSGKPR